MTTSSFRRKVWRLIVSNAAVFGSSRNAPPQEGEEEPCVTRQKRPCWDYRKVRSLHLYLNLSKRVHCFARDPFTVSCIILFLLVYWLPLISPTRMPNVRKRFVLCFIGPILRNLITTIERKTLIFKYYFVLFRYLRSNKKKERNKVRLFSFLFISFFYQKSALFSEAMNLNPWVVNKDKWRGKKIKSLGKDDGDSDGDEVVKNAIGLVSKTAALNVHYTFC